ncbi:hypothetical protein H6P81_013331 [Aristolochia fimbriata]|uniref:Uncharacterized protein n=1 Tax=Aristolochia fimbriata TaxID=158543 RepID=A0AAV7EEE5_ARIFI|nr:hypothetical protein H6P81_013331 [Aristolochia fimbriata]
MMSRSYMQRIERPTDPFKLAEGGFTGPRGRDSTKTNLIDFIDAETRDDAEFPKLIERIAYAWGEKRIRGKKNRTRSDFNDAMATRSKLRSSGRRRGKMKTPAAYLLVVGFQLVQYITYFKWKFRLILLCVRKRSLQFEKQ